MAEDDPTRFLVSPEVPAWVSGRSPDRDSATPTHLLSMSSPYMTLCQVAVVQFSNDCRLELAPSPIVLDQITNVLEGMVNCDLGLSLACNCSGVVPVLCSVCPSVLCGVRPQPSWLGFPTRIPPLDRRPLSLLITCSTA